MSRSLMIASLAFMASACGIPEQLRDIEDRLEAVEAELPLETSGTNEEIDNLKLQVEGLSDEIGTLAGDQTGITKSIAHIESSVAELQASKAAANTIEFDQKVDLPTDNTTAYEIEVVPFEAPADGKVYVTVNGRVRFDETGKRVIRFGVGDTTSPFRYSTFVGRYDAGQAYEFDHVSSFGVGGVFDVEAGPVSVPISLRGWDGTGDGFVTIEDATVIFVASEVPL